MKLNEKIKILKENAKDEIILVKSGNFYIAVGDDAIFLSKLLNLKCTCFTKGVCKVGVPVNSIDKYVLELAKTGYSFLVYDINSEGKIHLKNMVFTHKKYNMEEIEEKNCSKCKKQDDNEKQNLEKAIDELKKIKEDFENGK